jgi:hypothetical protein
MMALRIASEAIVRRLSGLGVPVYRMPAPSQAAPPFILFHPLDMRMRGALAVGSYRVTAVGRGNEAELYDLAARARDALAGFDAVSGHFVALWPGEEVRLVEEEGGALWVYVGFIFRVLIA